MEIELKGKEVDTSNIRSEETGNLGDTDDIAVKEFIGSAVSDAYRLKSDLVTKAFTDIGMGRYQWEIFVITGLGWATNNLMTQGLSTMLIPIDFEFHPGHVTYAIVAYYVGLAIGSSFWGIAADTIGRLHSFNITLVLTGIFCAAVGGANNFTTFVALWPCIGFFSGGSVPVSALVFLEFVPASHQWLLVLLQSWWCFGQVTAGLVGWVFIANFSCPESEDGVCLRKDNMGWRYTLMTLGLLTLFFAVLRMIVFKMPESPRFLLSVGRDKDAIEAINYIARRNGKPEPLTLADLEAVNHELGLPVTISGERLGLGVMGRIKASVSEYNGEHIKALFATRKGGIQCALLWTIWTTIGMAYPLYFNFIPSYLASKFVSNTSLDNTYKKYCIVGALGVVGTLLAALLAETRLGRRWVMAISFFLSGVFLFLYTTATNERADLGFQCAIGVFANLTYSILFAYTPESFPAPHRGAGNGIGIGLQFFAGVFAPVIAAKTGFTTVPIYASAGLFCACAVMTSLLPFETRNHAAI